MNLSVAIFVSTSSEFRMPAPQTVYTILPSPDSTLAVETSESGPRSRKHLFTFDRFHGSLLYNPDQPLNSTLTLTIDAASVICRSSRLKQAALQTLSRYVAEEALSSSRFPQIHLASTHFSAKPLRGYVAEATLDFRGGEYPLKANIGFGVLKNERVQIDADASLSLTRLGIARPSSLFGLVQTADEIVLHALIWGLAAPETSSTSSRS